MTDDSTRSSVRHPLQKCDGALLFNTLVAPLPHSAAATPHFGVGVGTAFGVEDARIDV